MPAKVLDPATTRLGEEGLAINSRFNRCACCARRPARSFRLRLPIISWIITAFGMNSGPGDCKVFASIAMPESTTVLPRAATAARLMRAAFRSMHAIRSTAVDERSGPIITLS